MVSGKLELTAEDIVNLTKIGVFGKSNVPKLFYELGQREFMNRLHPDAWRNLLRNTSDDRLISVFRALVMLDDSQFWHSSSVSAAIWVYGIINNQGLDKDLKITDFALKNCNNPWIPFGSSYYGRRTIDDLLSFRSEKARISSFKAERYNKVLQRVSGRKEARALAIAELRKLTHEQRGKLKKHLADEYAHLSTIDKLEMIAGDSKYPPELYPYTWIQIPKEQIASLPVALVKKLVGKLSSKTKGPWRRFVIELKRFNDGI